MNIRQLILCTSLLNINAHAQHMAAPIAPALPLPTTSGTNEEPSPGFHGYVQTHTAYDTRQAAGLWTQGLNLAPMPAELDAQGCDKNEQPQFTMIYALSVIGYDTPIFTVGNAQVSGKCYAQFQGLLAPAASALQMFGGKYANVQSTTTSGIATMASTYLTIKWPHAIVKAGHDYHPFYPLHNPPHILSGNSGIPFVPAVFNPQIEITFGTKNFKIAPTIYSYFLYNIFGPRLGEITNTWEAFFYVPVIQSPLYIIDSGLPAFNLKACYTADSGSSAWLAFDIQQIRPLLAAGRWGFDITRDGYQTATTVTSKRVGACVHFKKPHFNFIAQIIGGQNGQDLVTLGGYAVSAVDASTSKLSYEPTRFVTTWTDITFPNKTFFTPGFFVGYTRNLGSKHPIYIKPISGKALLYEYIIASNWHADENPFDSAWHAKDIVRVSTFARCLWGPVEIGTELEWTRACYSEYVDEYAIPKNCHAVTNLHADLVVTYTF